MRTILAVGLTLTAATVFADGQWWEHTLMRSGFFGFVPYGYINERGDVAYTTNEPGKGWQAWLNTTNVNEQYLGPGSWGMARGLNDKGQITYRAVDAVSQRVMVDGTDYYTQIYPANRDYNNTTFEIKGVDEQGRPFWYHYYEPNGRGYEVFLGTTQLSPPGYRGAGIELEDMNRDGVVVWSAWSSVGTRPVHDVYRNDVNLSEPVLGLYRDVTYHSRVNAHGDVLWSGSGTNTAGKEHLFLNQTSLTTDWVQGHRGIDVEGLNDRGDYLWLLTDGDGRPHLYLNRENLSRKVFGATPYSVFQLGNRLSQSGDVLWAARDKTTDIAMLFLNETEVSHAVLGIDPDWPYTTVGAAFGFDARGNYVWKGTGPNTGYRYHTFFNDFDVSLDAIPSGDIYHSEPFALNSKGDLFWGALLNDGSIVLYRSRLVCEPHAALALLLLPVLKRRRRSGGRGDAGL